MTGFELKFAAIGITIVFASLAVIVLAVSLIRRADSSWQSREDRLRKAAANREQNIDTTTLVLLTAAAGTMLTGRFHIRKVRRLRPADVSRGPWSVQGRAILHGSHVVPKKR
ncbi:MAG: hypothetical protein GY841_05715 [FCB group bacterium]|nr:hypothetical protein [FCB group bacterium]